MVLKLNKAVIHMLPFMASKGMKSGDLNALSKEFK